MATQPATAARRVTGGRTAAPDPADWRAYHLFYHADRDRLLVELVRPTVAALQASGDILGFYFVRYDLGGPHLRLRVRPAPGRAAGVDARVREAAAAFFARWPSTEPVAAEAILRQNAGIVATDPLATTAADEVHPDNSVHELPPVFEVQRYGGPGLLRHSLDFFALSSQEALDILSAGLGNTAGQRLAAACRLLVRQAWGFARDGEEFTALLGYASWMLTGEWTARFIRRGDEAFERQRAGQCRLLREELEGLARADDAAGPGSLPALAEGARRLARGIRTAGYAKRWIITASQLHMTANRLGLLNPEELYLGQMMWRAARELSETDPVFWQAVWAGRAATPARPVSSRAVLAH